MDRKPQAETPACHTEFVASWNGGEGVICVSLDDYELVQRELTAAKTLLASYRLGSANRGGEQE